MLSNLSSINTINKYKQNVVSLPAVIQTMSNIYVQNPFGYWAGDSGTIVKNTKANVISFRQTVSNQISPYTFKNGIYYVTTSEPTTGTNNNGGDLFTTFCGNINNVPDVPWYSASLYSNSGSYTGSNYTITSGNTVYGEWIQIQLPYKLYLTTYQINSAASNVNSYYNNLFTTTYYICGSNDGTTWTTLENRTGVTTLASGQNTYTVQNQVLVGYYYFRFIGCAIGALSNSVGNRMCVNLALGGTYRG